MASGNSSPLAIASISALSAQQAASWAETLLSDERRASTAAAQIMFSDDAVFDELVAQRCAALSVLFRSPATSKPLVCLRNLSAMLEVSKRLLAEGAPLLASDYALKALNNMVMAHPEAQLLFSPSHNAGARELLQKVLQICSMAGDARDPCASSLIACRFLFRLVGNNPPVLRLLRVDEELMSTLENKVMLPMAAKLQATDRGSSLYATLYEACTFLAKLSCALLADGHHAPATAALVPCIGLWIDVHSGVAAGPDAASELLGQAVNALFMVASWPDSEASAAARETLFEEVFVASSEQALATHQKRLETLASYLVHAAMQHDRGAKILVASSRAADGAGGSAGSAGDRDNVLIAALTVALQLVRVIPEVKPALLSLLTEASSPSPPSSAAEPTAPAGGAGAAEPTSIPTSASPSGKSIPLHTVHLLQTLDEGVQVLAYELLWELCDASADKLVTALTFPLAAGILQSKGAIRLPAE